MKTKTFLIATTLITSGLLAGCGFVDSTDPIKASSNVEHIQSVIHNEVSEDDNDIEVIHNEDNNLIGEITID
ncbi:Lipoprotein [Candidatus Liberibacter solanacearum]